jgi:hypothetical protein
MDKLATIGQIADALIAPPQKTPRRTGRVGKAKFLRLATNVEMIERSCHGKETFRAFGRCCSAAVRRSNTSRYGSPSTPVTHTLCVLPGQKVKRYYEGCEKDGGQRAKFDDVMPDQVAAPTPTAKPKRRSLKRMRENVKTAPERPSLPKTLELVRIFQWSPAWMGLLFERQPKVVC